MIKKKENELEMIFFAPGQNDWLIHKKNECKNFVKFFFAKNEIIDWFNFQKKSYLWNAL